MSSATHSKNSSWHQSAYTTPYNNYYYIHGIKNAWCMSSRWCLVVCTHYTALVTNSLHNKHAGFAVLTNLLDGYLSQEVRLLLCFTIFLFIIGPSNLPAVPQCRVRGLKRKLQDEHTEQALKFFRK